MRTRTAARIVERAAALLGELDSTATMPPGEYNIGLTHTPHGDFRARSSRP